MGDGHVRTWKLAFLLTIRANLVGQTLYERSQALASNLAFPASGARTTRRARVFAVGARVEIRVRPRR